MHMVNELPATVGKMAVFLSSKLAPSFRFTHFLVNFFRYAVVASGRIIRLFIAICQSPG